MSHDLESTFRTLAAFAPERKSLSGAPWEDYVDWAIGQGLAPLAAYNLEYRLAGGGAPEWVRDRLLSIYQGTLNDNVLKLVNFKRTVDELEGRKVLLLGAASFAETLYPHIGFRPVLDIRLLVQHVDLGPFSNFLSGNDFQPESEVEDADGAERVLSDGNTQLLLFSRPLEKAAATAGVFERALPAKVYGPSVYRPDLEDAILLACLEHARAGYEVPLISFVDLRELLLGGPSMGGSYSRPVDAQALKARASEWGLQRALYATGATVARLFPEAAEAVRPLLPELGATVRVLLDAAVVGPLSQVGRRAELKLAPRVRRTLVGAE